MSNNALQLREAESANETLIVLTNRAFSLCISAAQSAADLVLGAKGALDEITGNERALDGLDREIDQRVAVEVTHSSIDQVREKLACLKCMIDLERVGDLLLSFATRADAVRSRLDMQDLRDLGICFLCSPKC